MAPIDFQIISPVEELKNEVECFRVSHYSGHKALSVRVCPNGFPGIVFQHSKEQSAIESIITDVGGAVSPPTLFLYGQIMHPSVMNFKPEFMSIQVVFKPYALKNLFNLNASTVTNNSLSPHQFGAEDLNAQLLQAKNDKDCLDLFTEFLKNQLKQKFDRDLIIEQSIGLIQKNINSITVQFLLENLHLSERQFLKRFVEAVGVSPQFYIRVKRFNEAIRLMDTGEYEKLSDVAYALNFYDQSHFIHDIKAFSGITPKSISQKVNDFHHDRVGSSYLQI